MHMEYLRKAFHSLVILLRTNKRSFVVFLEKETHERDVRVRDSELQPEKARRFLPSLTQCAGHHQSPDY